MASDTLMSKITEQCAVAPAAGRIIKSTLSLCPECLEKIEAEVVARAGEVWLDKTCPSHGHFSVLLAADARHYYEARFGRGTATGCCTSGCGPSSSAGTPGPAWKNHSCTLLIEITERCNLSCPTCFAGSSPQHSKMMSLETFRSRIEKLLDGGKRGADTIQISGGEPTIHPDLLAMVEHCFGSGFTHVTINSNGIKLAQRSFVERLAACAGRHAEAKLLIYLQFDGFDAATHLQLRGRDDLLSIKQKALENCLDAGISVHPVMTLTRGINDHEAGAFVSLAAGHPGINHIVIQPAMYSGRYENPRRSDRLTLADTARLIIEQFGVFEPEDFGPIPCADPNCHGIAVALRTANGLLPVSRYFPGYESWSQDVIRGLIDRVSDTLDGPGGLITALEWVTSEGRAVMGLEQAGDAEIDRLLDAMCEIQASGNNGWQRMLTISIKPFMDALSYDQDRIDSCCVHILDDEGNPVSLCEYNALHRSDAMRRDRHGSPAA